MILLPTKGAEARKESINAIQGGDPIKVNKLNEEFTSLNPISQIEKRMPK
jgi:hypothetical protein